MRYLKSYKLFESDATHFKPLIDSIKDVLADVVDIGFDVYLLKDPNGSYTDPIILSRPIGGWDHTKLRNHQPLYSRIEAIRISIEHNPPEYSSASFKYKDIKDSINHLIEYMRQEFGYNDFVYQDKYTEFNLNKWIPNKLPIDDEDVAVIEMMFYKPYKDVNESISSIDYSSVSDIVKDVMAGHSENYEFDYKVTNIKDHAQEPWYRKNFDISDDFAILEITPDDTMVISRGFTKSYSFTGEWAKMLIFLSNHLNDYGYKSRVVTHVVSGVNQFATIPQYVSRVYREKGKGGPTGEVFSAPFSVYITKI